MLKSTRIHVTSPSKLPAGEHWAIIEGSSVHHEESGVWAPGHGYPAYSEDIINYYAYTDKEEFEADLKREIDSKNRFGGRSVRGIHISGSYTSETVVHLKESNESRS